MVQLSNEVKNWFRGVFRTCNATVAAKLAHVPTLHEAFLEKLVIGSRVLPFDSIASLGAKTGTHPTFTQVSTQINAFDSAPHKGGWKLEHFVVSGLLGCKEGYRTDLRNDETLETVFFRRSAPISAAIGITIDAPSDVQLLSE